MVRRKPDKSTQRYAGSSKPARYQIDSVTVSSGAVVKVGSNVYVDVADYDDPCVGRVVRIYKEGDGESTLDIRWYYYPQHTKQMRQDYHAECEIFSSEFEDNVPADSVLWTCAVLSMEKYVSFLNYQATLQGGPKVFGPVAPDKSFKPSIDLAACKNLGNPDGADANGTASRKRARQDDANDENRAASRPVNGTMKMGNSGATASMGENRAMNQGQTGTGKQRRCQEQANGNKVAGQEEGEEEVEDENRVFMCRGRLGGCYDYKREEFLDCHISIYCVCDKPYNPDLDMVQCFQCNDWYHFECLGMSEEDQDMHANGKQYKCPRCQPKEEPGITQPGRKRVEEAHSGEEN